MAEGRDVELFRPRRADGRAEWRVIFDWITEEMVAGRVKINDVIEHDDLVEVLGTDRQDSSYYSAVNRAIAELVKVHGRTLISERGKGYRLIAGVTMLKKVDKFVEKSRQEYRKGLETAQGINDNDVSIPDRGVVDKIRIGMAAVANILSLQAEKMAEHDEEIAMLKSTRLDDRARARATEEELAELKRRMARLEDR